mgnify:CR=1 FL=1
MTDDIAHVCQRKHPGPVPLRPRELDEVRKPGHYDNMQKGAMRTLIGRLIATIEAGEYLANWARQAREVTKERKEA